MVCVRGLLDRVVERRVRGTAEVSVAVEATAVWSRLFLYLDIRARGYVSRRGATLPESNPQLNNQSMSIYGRQVRHHAM